MKEKTEKGKKKKKKICSSSGMQCMDLNVLGLYSKLQYYHSWSPDCGCFAWWISWLKFDFRDKDFLGFSNLSIFLMLYFLYN